MKICLKTNKHLDIEMKCFLDGNYFSNVSFKKRKILNVSPSVRKIEMFNYHKKTNILGFIFMTFFCAFLETQKTNEKRNFISYYNFFKPYNLTDFMVCLEYESYKDCIEVYLESKKIGNIVINYWKSNDINVINIPQIAQLRHSLYELISFWAVILFIPCILISGIVFFDFYKNNEIFDLGIFLIIFLIMVFIINTIVFIYQYKKVVKEIKKI